MTGWRKRQVVDMARESHMDVYGLGKDHDKFVSALERLVELARADERDIMCERFNISKELVHEKAKSNEAD